MSALLEGYSLCERQQGFSQLIGPFYQQLDDPAQCAVLIEAQHCNPEGFLHGGMTMGFIDFLMYHAIGLEFGIDSKSPTLQADVQFLSGGRAGELLLGRADISHTTGSMIFCRCQVWVAEGEAGDGKQRKVAQASGLYKKMRKKT